MSDNNKLSPEDFVLQAVEKLPTPPHKGIHSVYSGFNQAFRDYFNGASPITTTDKMKEEGTIVVRPVKGGVMLYKPGDAPESTDALKKILEGA